MLEKLEDVECDVASLLELVKSGVAAGLVTETDVVCDDVGERVPERVSETLSELENDVCNAFSMNEEMVAFGAVVICDDVTIVCKDGELVMAAESLYEEASVNANGIEPECTSDLRGTAVIESGVRVSEDTNVTCDDLEPAGSKLEDEKMVEVAGSVTGVVKDNEVKIRGRGWDTKRCVLGCRCRVSIVGQGTSSKRKGEWIIVFIELLAI
ncbi:hypothetical protein IW262DRAFT_1291481 [Armillaria fumosa]|nr:hypothetical protein IW262DRAFT_1291481 [Armillaria fumosa]